MDAAEQIDNALLKSVCSCGELSPNRVVSACCLPAQCIEENRISALTIAKFSETYCQILCSGRQKKFKFTECEGL